MKTFPLLGILVGFTNSVHGRYFLGDILISFTAKLCLETLIDFYFVTILVTKCMGPRNRTDTELNHLHEFKHIMCHKQADFVLIHILGWVSLSCHKR